ncbi:PDZ domain-containing protein, partial [candidate division KSB1 bacterium]|nr:PDZ domain-containing protein [candidate division KSB1 bacterium]
MRKTYLIFGSIVLLLITLVFQTGYAQIEKNVKIKKMGKPALGVMITDPGAELLEQRGLDGGALIRKVLKESEAEKIGLQKNDIIIKFDSKDVESAGQLKDLITGFESEKTVDITVNRDGNIKSVKAHLKPSEKLKWTDDEDVTIHLDDKMHGPDSHVFFKKKMRSSDKGGFLGVHAENLSDQLLKYFEVEHGVLIEKVIEDSPAEKAD